MPNCEHYPVHATSSRSHQPSIKPTSVLRQRTPETRIINPLSLNHTHTVINLHGRGSNAEEYSDEFCESEDSSGLPLNILFPTIKWVFPTAPEILSERFQTTLSQWFDMWSTEDPHERCGEEHTLQLRRSVTALLQVVRDESEIVGLGNIILCSISQGAATALALLSELDEPVCGFVGFSTWLPAPFTSGSSLRLPSQIPVFLAHCEDDNVIASKYGDALREAFQDSGVAVEFHLYACGGHWMNEPDGIDDVKKFMEKLIQRTDELFFPITSQQKQKSTYNQLEAINSRSGDRSSHSSCRSNS